MSKGLKAFLIIEAIVILAFGIFAFTSFISNGYESVAALYLAEDGKPVSEISIPDSGEVKLEVRSAGLTHKTEGYTVKITPNAQNDFDYIVQGKVYKFSAVSDLAEAFEVTPGDGEFTFKGHTLRELLASYHGVLAEDVTINSNVIKTKTNYFILTAERENGVYRAEIQMSYFVDIEGLGIDEEEVILKSASLKTTAAAPRAIAVADTITQTRKTLILNENNGLGNGDNSKITEWLSGRTYDSFVYKIEFYSGYDNRYEFQSKSDAKIQMFAGTDCDAYCNNHTYSGNGIDFFTFVDDNRYGYTSDDDALLHFELGQYTSSYFYLTLTITDEHIVFSRRNYNDIDINTIWEFVAGSKQYNAFKNFIFGGFTRTDTVDALMLPTEYIELYKHETLTTVPLPETPVKEGHTFAGWYYDEALTRPYVAGDPIYENTALYAKFNINLYRVTFDTYGADEQVDWKAVEWNTVVTLPETPTKRGYNFLGWFLEDGTEYTDQPITEDTTITAKWEIIKFTVTFYVDGEVYATKEVEYGTTFSDIDEELKTDNLKLISLITDNGELRISKYLNTLITGECSVRAAEISTAPSEAQLFLMDYPWIFAACGAGLTLIVTAIGVTVYILNKNKQVKRRKKR